VRLHQPADRDSPLATQEIAIDKNLGDREIKTLPEIERFIELGDAELEKVSGARRGNDDDIMEDLEIQR
jgi:hypothetical protein